ncbi:MAG: RNA polymerase sigma factor [Vicinamibacteria bacterium]
MGPTDEELVDAFRGGDLAAFDVLVRRWDRKVRGAIHRILGSEDDARELCQETFLKAYRALGSFKGEARFSSWLYQIALNLCRDRMRRRKGRTVSLDELEEDGKAIAIRRPSALDLVVARDLARAVAEAVAALPEEQREVIVLKEYQELTFVEIADVLGVPLSTVKTRLYRGLSQLRLQLERQGIDRAPVPAAMS